MWFFRSVIAFDAVVFAPLVVTLLVSLDGRLSRQALTYRILYSR